jgi:hypothetical protein
MFQKEGRIADRLDKQSICVRENKQRGIQRVKLFGIGAVCVQACTQSIWNKFSRVPPVAARESGKKDQRAIERVA